MDAVEFWKMSGSGNDFILIDNRGGSVPEDKMSDLVRQACRRRVSVGADGVIFVVESRQYDFGWRFLNADGGEVEMCGNGGRCVARFAYLKGIADRDMVFETRAGPVSAEVRDRRVKVLMPEPGNFTADIEMDAGDVVNWKSVDFINTGVPHVVVHVDDLQDYPVDEQGRLLRYHPLFSPEGTNADFFQRAGEDLLDLRTYERGVEGETLACGTGAIAAVLVASARGFVASPARVRTRGGEVLTVHFKSGRDSFEQVRLEGDTSVIYQGVLHEEALGSFFP